MRSATELSGPAGIRPVVEVRDIRVLIASGTTPVRFSVEGPYTLRGSDGTVLERRHSSGRTEVSCAGNRLTVGAHRLPAGSGAELVPRPGATIEFWRRKGDGGWSPAVRYAGILSFVPRERGRFVAINSLDVDTYVAGVLCRELYPDFHREAYRAQAVAARTYAMYEMSVRQARDYDVTATESSQVYGGLPRGGGAAKAVEAAHYTRGIVATWTSPRGERIFCTYYSSACGGMSQAAADCKSVREIPPLAGGVKCNYCRIAKGEAYRWKPVRIHKRDLSASLFARYPDLERRLGAIRRVEVAARSDAGRPTRVRLVGTTGANHVMVGENFRLAVGSRRMRSTDCKISDDGDYVVLSNGRGFGHGMGLCQWGTQGQALAGRKAGQILKHYYPGMHLTRAY